MAQRTRQDKIEITNELADRLQSVKVLYLTDFTGLDVQSMTELRRRFREAGSQYMVVKNRLAIRALKKLDYPDIAEHLQGPTGFVLGDDDPVTPAKTLREFAQQNEQRPALKVGVVNQRIVSVEEIKKLAELPPREELLAGIAGSMVAPVSGMVGVLGGLIRDITYMIGEVARKNEAAS